MNKNREIARLIQTQAEFRKHVLAFPARQGYKEWVINHNALGFEKRLARLKEMVALLLSRNEDGSLRLKPPSAEKVDSYCNSVMQMGLDYFNKRPGGAQMSMLAPCITAQGDTMLRWFMFYNEALFESMEPGSIFNVIQLDMDDPTSLLDAVGAMGAKGDPVEVLRQQVAKQIKVELRDPRSDGLRQDELGDLFEDPGVRRSRIGASLMAERDS